MPLYPKGKNKKGEAGWEIVIYVKGRRHARVVRGTKREAKEVEARWRVELEDGGRPNLNRSVPTFSDFCVKEYAPNARLHLKPSTWIKRTSHLATLIEFFGSLRLTEIDAAQIDDYKRHRQSCKLKAVSINNELRVLRRVLKFAHEERRIQVSPGRFRFLRETGDGRVKVWTHEQVAKLFEASEKTAPDLLPVLVFLANTGARKGEALALTWERVDLERGLVMIWPSDEWSPKSGRPREVPINDSLRPWLARGRGSSRWVFPAPRTGERYATWPQLQYQRAQKLAGLAGGVHTLRHTFASHFLQQQPDVFLLARILGHSDVAVTKLYSHLLPDHLERGRNAVAFAPSIGPAGHEARRRWSRKP